MRTSPRICQRKARYASEAAALEVAAKAPFPLRPYRCELCRKFHLTSRTKGLKVPAFQRDRQRALKNEGSAGPRIDEGGGAVRAW